MGDSACKRGYAMINPRERERKRRNNIFERVYRGLFKLKDDGGGVCLAVGVR